MPESIVYGPPEEEATKLKFILACKACIASGLNIDPEYVNTRYVESTQEPSKTSLLIVIAELFKEGKDGDERTPKFRNYLMENMKTGIVAFIDQDHFSHKIYGLTIVPNMVDYRKEKGEYRSWEI